MNKWKAELRRRVGAHGGGERAPILLSVDAEEVFAAKSRFRQAFGI